MGLREKLDLADTAAPALDVETGAGSAGAFIAFANTQGQRADFLDCAKVERLPPYKRRNFRQKVFTRFYIARSRTGANESGTFPCKRLPLIMRQGGAARNRERADLACRTQPQIDPSWSQSTKFRSTRRT